MNELPEVENRRVRQSRSFAARADASKRPGCARNFRSADRFGKGRRSCRPAREKKHPGNASVCLLFPSEETPRFSVSFRGNRLASNRLRYASLRVSPATSLHKKLPGGVCIRQIAHRVPDR